MEGILYGIGVGPGDPELMTLKAVRLMKECGVVVLPDGGAGDGAAYQIAMQAVPSLKEKEQVFLNLPMTRDKEKLAQCRAAAAEQICTLLLQGKNLCFLTLGDPTVYSTYSYIHTLVQAKGGKAQFVPGITSFCAVAARLGEALGEAQEPIHIIPASYKGTEEYLGWQGTKVLMKTGKSMGKVKEMLSSLPVAVSMVENCGMPGERVFHSLKEIDENAGYFSILVVKDREEA